ncbi:MAG: two-component system sensor histidine kinase/response regulator [Pedosphaera sp.]|nr:two-component system sensor histidine kinase/response regulator [Pedosphaera sp.]
MNLSIGKKITIGFALALAALVGISLVSHRNVTELNTDARWVTHTMEVQQRLESTYAGLLEAQGSARGYEYLAEAPFREAFKAASIGIKRDVQTLRTLTADNPNQQRRLDKLESMISSRLELSQKLMDLNPSIAAGKDAQVAVKVQEGQKQTDEIHRLIFEMEEEERQLLGERQKRAAATVQFTSSTIIYGTLLAFVLVGGAGLLVTRSITTPLQVLRAGAAKIGGGDYAHRVPVDSRDEVGHLATVFNQMAEQVQQRQMSLAEQDWLKTGLTRFSMLFQGQRDPAIVCQRILEELASVLDARHSVLYVPDTAAKEVSLKLRASYACDDPKPVLKPGEGLAGQCFLGKQRVLLSEIPSDYIKINSALGEADPVSIIVLPALFEGQVKAVIELASFQRLTEIQLAFLNQLAESIGIVLNTIEAGVRTEELLRQSTALSENLQEQQAELNEKNQELEAQTDRLRQSEQRLQEQQEELKQANEEMEQTNEELQQANEEMAEKTVLLTGQKKEVERTNREIEQAREALEGKARQLALTSKYKSEFLANMSHELRTPLNSLLILSKILSENTGNNLTEKQMQYARTIHSSGDDLLELINDILDLSKIESGAVEVEANEVMFPELAQLVESTFRHVAESKKLDFHVRLDPQLPRMITTDARRLEQVLKNLLSNAFKFTEKGSVGLKVGIATSGWEQEGTTLNETASVIAFTVADTGIGIPKDKQDIIFEAFQQADAGTARKYGGTGLGLSISREIARLLGGSLQVESVPGQGSSFTLYLPASIPVERMQALLKQRQAGGSAAKSSPPIRAEEEALVALPAEADTDAAEDDRTNLQPGDLVLLIIEDDRHFARILVEFAREKNFKVIVARNAAQGIALASQFKPAAVTLDLRLPDNDGWVVLDRLKHDPKTRHIPVHIISVEEDRERGLKLGAVSFLQKPVTKETLEGALSQTIEFINRPIKNLLIVEDDRVQRQSLVELVGNGDVHTTAVGTAAEALAALETARFDCLVLDLGLPDMSGIELIREIHNKFGDASPPVIVYTGKELTREEETELRRVSESIILKDVRSPERLLDETALFLHRVQTKLPESKRRMIEQARKSDSVLSGRKVLVVDDDVRNIFAITAALENYQMQVFYTESGQAGIELLQKHPDIEAVLMDVMMPEMDGYEAIRRIRQIEQFKKLPIISVTAKAMKGDREKCLQAGASDYITKPVDMDQLRSLLRVWLYK